jgi:ABC-type transport system substrate-binding protein
MVKFDNGKFFSVTLISMLLVSVFVAGAMVSPVKAPANIIMWIVTTTNPGPGYYGGYHDIVALLQTEFAKIGITLKWAQYSPDTWEAEIWEAPTWNKNGTAYGDPNTHSIGKDGWDFTIFEWWVNPSSYIWIDEQVYSWATPPTGWNIESYNDTRMDYLWQKAQTTLDSATHQTYMWKWQEEWMHNPECIPIYYADTYTARAAYVDNYDETSWLYDLSQFDINEAKFDEVTSDPKFSTRRSIGNNTLLYAIAEPIWNDFSLITWTYTEEAMNVLKTSTLYRNSRENLAYPSSGKFIIKPNLATKIPDASDWRQITDTDGKVKWVVRIPIVHGLTWTDGVPFNATDVAFTYNTICSLPDATAYGDFSFLLDRVQVVDTYTVDFIYKPGMGPDYDFAGYNAHGWGLSMLPWHQLKGQDLTAWKTAPWNKDIIPDSADGHPNGGSTQGLECLGPYVPVDWKPPYEWVKFQLRPEFISAMNANGISWTNTLPKYWYMSYIPDDATRIAALQTLEVDMIEYPTASTTVWENMMSWPSHRVSTYSYPASHPLWIQHRNTILSNRYVRLAIAYAIPYQQIFNNILPGWGVKTAYPGKTFVTPWQDAFDTDLGNYVYDINKAKMYMDMYRNSTVGGTPALAPSGDHDFSGFVDMLDYPIWVSNLGKTTSQFPWYPSTPVDPDNTNNGYCDIDDFPGWANNFGRYYPFQGAW